MEKGQKVLKIFLFILTGLFLVVGILIFCLNLFVISDIKKSARIEVLKEVESPKKEYVSTVFVFHTSGFDSYPFTFINLRKDAEKFDPILYKNYFSTTFKENEGNVLELSGKVDTVSATWVDDGTIAVTFPLKFKKEKIDKQENAWKGIRVVYR